MRIKKTDAVATVGHDSQPELTELARRVPIEQVDRRSPEERFQGWLRSAQEFEVVKVTG